MRIKLILLLTLILAWSACGDKKSEGTPTEHAVEKATEAASHADPMSNKGIGPVSSIALAEIDTELVSKGETEFKAKCTACHKISKRHIGPALKGITERRSPEWIMNMILNPEEMVQKDPVAKQLLIDYNGAPMANQNLTEDEARAILEYFRTKN